jgi:formylglycine-generating enzyme required for sulfatase activity
MGLVWRVRRVTDLNWEKGLMFRKFFAVVIAAMLVVGGLFAEEIKGVFKKFEDGKVTIVDADGEEKKDIPKVEPKEVAKKDAPIVEEKKDIAKVEAKEPRPGEVVAVEIAKGVKMKFCWVPAGEAQLGSPKAERLEMLRLLKEDTEPAWLSSEAEDKRGKFKTKGFWLGKYEVTQEQWEALLGENPSWFQKNGGGKDKVKGQDTSKYPVENVSWNDCQVFLKKLNNAVKQTGALGKGEFVLPHEDEWEYACRGGKGNKQAFYFGDELNGKLANSDGNYPYGTTTKGPYLQMTTEIGSYERAAPHPWGLSDMHGNVWEWCENWYDSEQKFRVVRGGSWRNDSRYCRSAGRFRYEPGLRNSSFGCRVAFRLD